MSFGYIYKIQFPNGKYYIGCTTTSLKQRKQEHKSCAKCGNTKCLYNALRKYDMVDTFELLEIDTADTIEELCEKEIGYIQEYNSYYINGNGYNMTRGGEGVNGYVRTEEDNKKSSEKTKKYFEDNPQARKDHGERLKKYYEDNPEARKEQGERLKKYYEDNPKARKDHGERLKKYHEENPSAAKEHGERLKKYYEDNPEVRKEHSEIMKKYYEDNPEAIIQMSKCMKKYYEDNPEAGKQHSIRILEYYENHPETRQKCSESQKKRFENPEERKKCSESHKKRLENPEERRKMSDALSNNRPFDVFTVDGMFIKTFTYQFEANEYLQKEYGITSRIKVGCVLAGARNSANGFLFKYK